MKKITINPNQLKFRESMQNRIDEVLTRYPDNNYPPITAVNYQIIDGHNRAQLAIDNNITITVVNLTQAEYDYLQNLNYDDMEISYAVLTAMEEIDTALNYIDQFAGSNIFERGEEAYNKLLEIL